MKSLSSARSPLKSDRSNAGDELDTEAEGDTYDGSRLAPRSCTDVPCLVIFVAFMVCMACITGYAFKSGKPHALSHGYNRRGEICGVDEMVADSPLLYWCKAGKALANGAPAALDLSFPTCVSACPGDNRTEIDCPQAEQAPSPDSGRGHGTAAAAAAAAHPRARQMSYPTAELAGLYCIPYSTEFRPDFDNLARSLMNSDGPIGNGWAKTVTAVAGLRRCWRVVVMSIGVAVVLGYLYLLLLHHYARPLVQITLLLTTAGSLLLGGYFLLGAARAGAGAESWKVHNLLFKQFDPSTAACLSALLGASFTTLGFIVACIACYARDATHLGVGCVEAACECIFAMPQIVILPAVEASCKLGLAWVLLSGLTWLLSTMDMTSNVGTLDRFADGWELLGAAKGMVAVYVLGILWILELTHAVSQFVISYAVVLWYFTPKPKYFGPHFPLLRGLAVGVGFHLGTLAMGSFLIASCRLARMALGYLARSAQAGGNQVCAMIAQSLSCCVACLYLSALRYVSKNAYIDVCLSSTSFCAAARHSTEFIQGRGGLALFLTGACFFFSAAGVLGISGAAGGLTYLMVSTCERWTSDLSPHYVADPYFVSGVSALLAGAVALSFMMIFDHTADTLLYAFVWNRAHGHNSVQKYAPSTLADLALYQPVAPAVARHRPSPIVPSPRGVVGVLDRFFSCRGPTKYFNAAAWDSEANDGKMVMQL